MSFNWWREAEPDEMSAQAIIDRVAAEWRAGHQHMQDRTEQHGTAARPAGSPHAAPEKPFGVSEAHRTMQQHKACRADQCPRKAAAQRTLIDAGHMTPDTSRRY
ncbi:hypothetical protein NRB20_31640 [Nocardia sp. RB20]|uniref:Uncharacterized protein n=1 Tax=Nocardia macrotermitis TaxID=2585198 RepID=A0A7K0D2X5_9NOCA|nr:hypothetical protein [Nocardia macrotermitis]